MKFHLLVAASALAVGLSMSGTAFADNKDHNQGTQNTAVALSDQDGAVIGAFAKGTDANNTMDGNANLTGLSNIQQNGGANSVLQDDNTLGAILNCSCSDSSSTNTSLAATSQNAVVLGGVSIGAVNRSGGGGSESSGFFVAAGGEQSSGGGHKTTTTTPGDHDSPTTTTTSSGGGGQQSSGFFAAGGGQQADWYHYDSDAVSSNNTLAGNLTSTGLLNISQNVGNNSVLQSANTVAAIIGTGSSH